MPCVGGWRDGIRRATRKQLEAVASCSTRPISALRSVEPSESAINGHVSRVVDPPPVLALNSASVRRLHSQEIHNHETSQQAPPGVLEHRDSHSALEVVGST